uniref:Probable membrane transporter protein n=1 Tax=Thermosporothrix sp. COM3 TaxID=2490863 RepID=A0A455SX29_9CHLR|nr:UPF0721 transmembrane protein [Thermosporothrix sp. COM3]
MTFLDALVLFLAAVMGGTLNAVAGGGSFFCFPALIFTGIPPIQANATNTVALWPASIASASAYRRELKKQSLVALLLLPGSSLIGGILGAQLLLGTSQATFTQLVPYLLLLATLLFAVSPPLTRLLRKRREETQTESTGVQKHGIAALVLVAFAQLLISIYGGFFGGGIGIMMLATLSLMGMDNIHEMNGIKTVLTIIINGAAVVLFILRGAVVWPQALLMILGSIIGGYAGAYYARKIDPKYVRIFVICIGLGLSAYFFIRQ